MTLTWEYGTINTLRKHFVGRPTYIENGIPYYNGFDLMRPQFFKDAAEHYRPEFGAQYLLAFQGDDLIGVLKWKRYQMPDHQNVDESDTTTPSYVAIRFIDIHQDHQRQGFAKDLIRAWSRTYLRADDRVVGGKLTEKGAASKLHKWVAREISQRYYRNEHQAVADWIIEDKDVDE